MTYQGLTFAVNIVHDSDTGAPWDNSPDTHGVVRNLPDAPAKGFKRLVTHFYYDVQASLKKALADEWVLSPEKMAELRAAQGGRDPTAEEVAQLAVFEDYTRLQAWCDDTWWWAGVIVTLLDTDGIATNRSASLWGIESDAGSYLQEVAQDLAAQMAADIGPATTHLVPVQVRKEPFA